MFSPKNHHIWDEHQWESHINEMARRHDYLRELITSESSRKPRWLDHMHYFSSKMEAVEAFIEEELLIEESNFPVEEEDGQNNGHMQEIDPDEDFPDEEEQEMFPDQDDEHDDMFDNPAFGEQDLQEGSDKNPEEDADNELYEDSEENPEEYSEKDFDEEDFGEIEELFEDIYEQEFFESPGCEYASLENISIYTEVRDLAAGLLERFDNIPDLKNSPVYIELVSLVLLTGSKLAAAYSMGFEKEVLGANIAYCKKALEKANQALEKLQKLKEKPLPSSHYYEIHKTLFELRNNIGMHIQDTRKAFQGLF